jgi:hypothetical protein
MKQLFIFFALLSFSLTLKAQTWDSPVHISDPAVTDGGITGQHTSMAVVNGNPAIAYYNAGNTSLVYMRASDASGTSWGSQITLDADGDVGQWASLAVVNGYPAVAYYDVSNGDLKYIIAKDANGTSWNDPVVIGGSNNLGKFISLKVVNGNPAVSYVDLSITRVRFCRANDAMGSTWGTKVNVTASGLLGLRNTSLEVVDGYPAIAYIYDNGATSLKYVRATDSNGTAWGTIINPAAGSQNAVTTTQICELIIVNGRPAIYYYGNSGSNRVSFVRAADATGTTWGSRVDIDVVTTAIEFGSIAIVKDTPSVTYYTAAFYGGDLYYARATDADGSAWGTPTTIAVTNDVGAYNSLVVVNDKPAVSYYDATNGDLMYMRASDTLGTTWGTPVSFSTGGAIGEHTSVAVVNSNPAMAFYDQANTDLKYVRATNTTGSTWGSPVSVDATGAVGQYTSLAIVNGNPAISYYDATNGYLKYVRASDASGTTWGSPVTVDNNATIGQHTKLVVINGNPAIAYYDVTNGYLKYVRAGDVSGTSWGSPVTVDNAANVGQYTSLLIVNGNPAISYYDVTNGDLKYVRASDASGTSWGSAATVVATNTIGQYTSLAIVSGNPAIAYYDVTNANLSYVRASDASGTTWGSPLTVASTDNVGMYASLTVVNGKPAIFYEELPSVAGLYHLKYIRATDATGTAWATPATLDATGGAYISAISAGADVYTAYYSEGHQLPSFIHGSITSTNWSGAASTTDWFTTGNWEGGFVPTSTIEAVIPGSLSFYPDINTGTASCNNMVINSGATVTISGGTLQVTDTLNNSGTITATGGLLELNGSSAQVIIAGTNTIENLTLNNSTGATISGSNALNITGTYTPTSGVLTTGGNLTLKSSATGTARIATGIGTYVSGNVTVEKYIPGKRVYRFFAHPFSTSTALSVLTDNIDITGSGGASNGFTATSSNSPSAYRWDAILGNNSTSGNNPGWKAFTNTNGAGANSWDQYTGARILVRGAKGEGLWNNVYTPSPTTIDMAGTLNQGDQVINVTKGDSSDFVMIGNPFPSQVDMNLTTSRSNMGSAYYVWDATQGTKGGYTSSNFSSSYILPAYSSFFTTLTADGSITFPESCKSTSADAGLFKTTGINNVVQLRIEDSTIFWDRFLLRFDDTTSNILDFEDAKELYNPEISFYSFSKDDTMLSIDTRPYVDSEIIQLGIYCPIQKNFRIIASEMNMPAGTKLFLKDKYLNKTEQITGAGYEYWFAVNSDTASWGDNRFELNTQGKPITGIIEQQKETLSARIIPNPTNGMLTLYYNGARAGKELNITISNITGTRIAQQTSVAQPTGNVRISLDDYPAGIYIIELRNGNNTIRQKIVRQ